MGHKSVSLRARKNSCLNSLASFELTPSIRPQKNIQQRRYLYNNKIYLILNVYIIINVSRYNVYLSILYT